MSMALFDTLTATAESLQRELTSGRLTSTQIVTEYHRAIDRHNGYLNAVSELAPGAMQEAQRLDDLRAQGTVLGPMHGIPILLKENINTVSSMGMRTSAGVVAFADNEPASNAVIVEKLIAAGMIILGKATMSELAWFKGTGLRSGWSALYGYSQSAYVRGGLVAGDGYDGHSGPSGSSSGSCIAASAGLAPVTIGTETTGSLVNPATRSELYTLKATRGIVPGTGILPVLCRHDIAGPLAKSPRDIANLLTILVDPSKTKVPNGGYISAASGTWTELKVGTLDPRVWKAGTHKNKPIKEVDDQITEETEQAYAKISRLAQKYCHHISNTTETAFDLDGSSALNYMWTSGMQGDIDHYLSELKTSKIRTLEELVSWNREHADVALDDGNSNQEYIESAVAMEHNEEMLRTKEAHVENVEREFMELFEDNDIDIIMCPSEACIHHFSAACGFPMATVPISTCRFNGRPFGLTIAARHHEEATLIRAMAAWEATFPPRQTPKAFLDVPEKPWR